MKMGGELLLNVASTMARSRANGPGIRAVVWVQGCTIGCPGCYNEFTHPHKIESLYTPSEVAKWILSIDGIDGVTFSGGEPFEQAEAVLQVIKEIKQEKQLDVFVFSGYKYAKLALSADKNVNLLLNSIDILSSGPYVEKLRDDSLLWRGSSNQKLHYLSKKYNNSMEVEWALKSPIEEFSITDKSIHITGFGGANSDVAQNIFQKLLNEI